MLKQIGSYKDDSTRYCTAPREIRRNKEVEKLCVKDNDGTIAATEEQQIKVITEYFKKILTPTGKSHKEYTLHKLNKPFKAEEIKQAVKKLKNGKSEGPHNLEAEFIKYAPITIHQEIANIFNTVFETEEELKELILGLPRPLQNQGKQKDHNIIDCYQKDPHNMHA